MTPEEWFAAVEPGTLLRAIGEDLVNPALLPPVVSRRSHLFACAIARQVWDLLSSDVQNAVLAAERYADGRASETDLLATSLKQQESPPVTAAQFALAAAQEASLSPRMRRRLRPYALPFSSVPAACLSAARAVAIRNIGPAPLGRPTTPEWHASWTTAFNGARALQADYLRNIFPPPGYTPQRDQAWITSTVMALARQMDESGDFSTVPILADALQDAGCDDQTILNCCRTPSHTHVRGNWVVDLVLGSNGRSI